MYQAPRGTSDILPEDQACWRFIEQQASKVVRLYGYKRIDTPVFEDTRLFIRSVGEETETIQNQLTGQPETVCKVKITKLPDWPEHLRKGGSVYDLVDEIARPGKGRKH